MHSEEEEEEEEEEEKEEEIHVLVFFHMFTFPVVSIAACLFAIFGRASGQICSKKHSKTYSKKAFGPRWQQPQGLGRGLRGTVNDP